MAAPVIPIVFGGLFIWSIYRRVRRNIGRQKLRPRRIIVSIVIFSVVSVLFFAAYLFLVDRGWVYILQALTWVVNKIAGI